jgi:hypothetical protein
MKKIKLLRGLALVLLIADIAYSAYAIKKFLESKVSAMYYEFQLSMLLIDLTKYLTIVPVLILIVLALNKFMRRGYFSTGGARAIRLAGILLMLQASLSPIIHYFTSYAGKDALMIIMFVQEAMLPLCFGIGLLAIADFIIRGNKLKEENQLTV